MPAPRNNYYLIENSAFNKHKVPFTEPGSTMSAEECAQLILQDTLDEISKQKL